MKCDLLIIGAGPIGLFTAFQAKMLDIEDVMIVDSLPAPGGQCRFLYPDKPIYDIPAYPMITGEELTNKLLQQLSRFKIDFQFNCKVNHIHSNFIVDTNLGLINAKTIIVTTGGGDLIPNKPPLDNLQKFENKSVFYTVPNKEMVKNKNIVIAGGGDSALDWAIELSNIAKNTYIIHRRNKFTGHPSSVNTLHELVNNGKIQLIVPYTLHKIIGSNDSLQEVIAIDLEGNIKVINADLLFCFFGLASSKNTFNLQSNEKNNIIVNYNMSTSTPGIYAAGDAVYYSGKLPLILSGFAEATTACYNAYNFIYPDKELHFQHSTSKWKN